MPLTVSPGSLLHDLALLLARLGLAALYIRSGWGKIFGFAGLTGQLAGVGFPLAPFGAILTILVELGCGIALLLGYRTRICALILAAFTVLASVLFHDFWSYGGGERQMQMIQFMKNMGLAGGLLALLAAGAGRFSLDGRGR
jgi:putative oxidoreductase